jgi:all-trans-retinol 13,14-reductase
MGKYDVVIAGSGLGGLVCGYILSKHGFKVIILEKNHQIGGCLQTFKRNRVVFDTGMHYIGSMDENQILHRFFKYLSLLDDVKLRKLDENGYDIISFFNKQYKFAMGYDAFADSLSNHFPRERKNISDYINRIRKIASESPLYNLQEISQNVLLNTESVKTSINEFIEKITPDRELQNVLSGNMPLYAGVKDKTPLYIHALINNFYIQSAYRIVGGSDCIANSLAGSIKNFGGEILTKANVVKFNCDNEKVISVELENGEIIEGERFISNIHPEATIQKLNTPMIRKAYRERIMQLESTISNFTVYIKFRQNKVPYFNSNFYHYNTHDVWACNNYISKDWPLNYLYMHQSPEIDNGFSEGALLISYMHFDEVKKWQGTPIGHRGDDYEHFKKQKSELLIDELEKSFPGIKQNIETYSSSSPLTYLDYTATKDGSMYGVLRDKNFPTQTLVSQRTRIPNLYMTGQNINSHGILGVTIGAIITCAEFLGVNTIIKDINQV